MGGPLFDIFQGFGALKAGRQSAKDEAAALAANEKQLKNDLAIEKSQLQREQDQARGSATVAAAASGGGIGSYDDLFEDNANQSLLDQALLEYDMKKGREQIRYDSRQRQNQYKAEAKAKFISSLSKATSKMSGLPSGSVSAS